MKKYKIKFSYLIIPIIIAFFNLIILFFPREIIQASKDGLQLWFTAVLPSLLPFIIGTNILISLGFVSFIGTLFEPIMYPLFRVSGCGSFALITGMTSGYPMGAKTVAQLRENNEINKFEAQRLLSFTNNSGPLFVIGAVGIGMLSSAKVGYFILLVHYLSAILNGIIFRYYKYDKRKVTYSNARIIEQAFINMHFSRNKDYKSFGKILGESISNAINTILLIGGYIILFSVIVEIFQVTHMLDFIRTIFMGNYTINENLFNGLVIGLLEVTNGCSLIAQAPSSKIQILLLCSIISFGGFSIHAQAISFTSKTDINSYIYILSKFMHSVLAFILGFLLYPIFNFEVVTTMNTYDADFNLIIGKLVFSSMAFIFSIICLLVFIILFNIFQ